MTTQSSYETFFSKIHADLKEHKFSNDCIDYITYQIGPNHIDSRFLDSVRHTGKRLCPILTLQVSAYSNWPFDRDE